MGRRVALSQLETELRYIPVTMPVSWKVGLFVEARKPAEIVSAWFRRIDLRVFRSFSFFSFPRSLPRVTFFAAVAFPAILLSDRSSCTRSWKGRSRRRRRRRRRERKRTGIEFRCEEVGEKDGEK